MAILDDRDLGMISVVAEEYENHRLPRLLGMLNRVYRGESLREEELEYLHRTLSIARLEKPVTHGHPELEEFYQHLFHLYRDITRAVAPVVMAAAG